MVIVLLFEDKGLKKTIQITVPTTSTKLYIVIFQWIDMIYKEYLMIIWYDVIVILFHVNRNSMNKMVYTPNFQILTLQTTK